MLCGFFFNLAWKPHTHEPATTWSNNSCLHTCAQVLIFSGWAVCLNNISCHWYPENLLKKDYPWGSIFSVGNLNDLICDWGVESREFSHHLSWHVDDALVCFCISLRGTLIDNQCVALCSLKWLKNILIIMKVHILQYMSSQLHAYLDFFLLLFTTVSWTL